jgi:hypothetical protein
MIEITQKPHTLPHPLIGLASLDSDVTGLLEGQFLQVFSILSSAAQAWSANLRLFGVNIARFGR